ncbi:PP2C family protein-serine/threonine phosphatase [Streptosporangium sp. NPDC004379]|uniref:PP2C family protein-serine/threonine phosphatase n=1 Tax=Streptosporangium sp. NPDC004379 TaxID=3366189 RepID=UPI00368AE976
MTDSPRDTARMLTGLLAASHLVALERLPTLVNEHAARAGLFDVQIYIVDLQQQVLRLMTGHSLDTAHNEGSEPGELRVDSTLAGRAFQEVRILPKIGDDDEVEWWWVPLLDGAERLGVIRVSARVTDDQALSDAKALASLVALLVESKRGPSDSYARLVRTRSMNVAAEMQQNLMPLNTFANQDVAVSAAQEPAYEVGGDAFDYAVFGDMVHLAIFDAMGHDTAAGITASLAVSACRHSRRRGADLVRTSENIERALVEQFGRANRFATAILAHLDTSTGELTWINRGHHPPVLIRDGRWVGTLNCPPAHPMGLDLGLPVTICTEQLEPGDRLLFYTDGVIEARDDEGREFGLERFIDFVVRQNAAGLPIPETLRRLIHQLLEYHDHKLQDDATVLLVEWRGSAQGGLSL